MQRQNLEGLRRQPWGAVATMILKSCWTILKGFWPFFAVIIFRSIKDGKTSITLLVSIALAIFAPIIGFVQYLFFRYGIVDNKFVIQKGIFKKEEIILPLSTIQGIQTSENFLDKMLNLVTVKLDATGTNQDKDKIHISLQEANLLREIILEKRVTIEESGDEKADNIEEDIISELSFGELLKLSITANHLRMLGILLALFFSFLENTRELLSDFFQVFKDETNAQYAASGFLFILYVAATLLLVATIISFASTFFKYANFKIKSHPKGLAVESGLINRLEQIVRLEKLQFISWQANFLRKKLPIYLLEFHSIGELDKEKLRVKLPITSQALLEQLIPYYAQPISGDDAFLSISKRYIVRKTLFNGVIPAIIIGAVIWHFQGWYAIASILLPILVYVWSVKTQQKFKVYANVEVLHIRKGTFGEQDILLNWKYIQAVELSSSYYQRKHDLSNVTLHTAGGKIFIPYLLNSEAEWIQNFAIHRVEIQDNLKWV